MDYKDDFIFWEGQLIKDYRRSDKNLTNCNEEAEEKSNYILPS